MSEKKNDGGPAFPRMGTVKMPDGLEYVSNWPGMTLRDYFAGDAPIALSDIPKEKFTEPTCAEVLSFEERLKILAQQRFAYADAMIKERDKP